MSKIDFNQWTDPTDFERNELVFEKRNKAYGAYAIRTNYNRTMVRALVCTVFFIVGLFMIPKISQIWAKETLEPLWTETVVIITPDDPVKKIEDKIEEDKIKKIETKKDVKSENPFRKIVDGQPDLDSLTMEDLNKLKISDTHNPNGTDSSEELFTDIGDLDSGNKIVSNITVEPPPPIFLPEMPEFIGGESALFKYLKENLEFPEYAKEQDKSGRVMVGFVVERDGSISNVKILSCSEKGYGFEEEAIRVISKMPRWKPGLNSGHPARVLFNIPLNFKLL